MKGAATVDWTYEICSFLAVPTLIRVTTRNRISRTVSKITKTEGWVVVVTWFYSNGKRFKRKLVIRGTSRLSRKELQGVKEWACRNEVRW